eukprot:TRINITY_DN22670_c0_g1_i1.p1 TRINITY_DN22670_c0_g1~~TRINITY_DN22670_c0_g1_i1.p1  ORF type:complete len:160 (+),score=22.03 TRINITY_DN22670_c0_g1_i1:412-891(+)
MSSISADAAARAEATFATTIFFAVTVSALTTPLPTPPPFFRLFRLLAATGLSAEARSTMVATQATAPVFATPSQFSVASAAAVADVVATPVPLPPALFRFLRLVVTATAPGSMAAATGPAAANFVTPALHPRAGTCRRVDPRDRAAQNRGERCAASGRK